MNLKGFPWGLHTLLSLGFAILMSLILSIPVTIIGKGNFLEFFLYALIKYGPWLFIAVFIGNFYPCWKKNVKDKQNQQSPQQSPQINQQPENDSSSPPTTRTPTDRRT